MKIAAISIADYAEATEGMPHDAERLFMRMLLKMYSREAGLPDSDAENAMMFGYRSVRPYKRLKDILLKFPCGIYIDDDTIKHDRVEQEIAATKTRRELARENGRKGGLANGKKESEETGLDEVCPKFRGSLPEVWTKFAGNFGETFPKLDTPIPIKSMTCPKTSPSPSPSPSEEKKELIETTTPRVESEVVVDERSEMISFIEQQFGGHCRPNAEKWLAGNIKHLGSPQMAEGWRVLQSALANPNECIAKPLRYWEATAANVQITQSQAGGIDGALAILDAMDAEGAAA